MTRSVHQALSGYFRAVPPDTIDDAVMEAQYRLWRKFYRADTGSLGIPPGAAWRWIATTARRLILAEHRRMRAQVPWLESDEIEKGQTASDMASSQVETALAADGERTYVASLTVDALLRILTPALAEVVYLHAIEGIPLEEIAAMAGCTPASIRQRHSRAMRILRMFCRADETCADRCGKGAASIYLPPYTGATT